MKIAAAAKRLRRLKKRSRPVNTENNSDDTKIKIGAFLTSKGAAIGAAIGSMLVLLGSVLEEKTSWFGLLCEVVKSVLFQ